MKIIEARQIYSAKMKEYHEQKKLLAKQREDLEKKSSLLPNGKEIYAQEAAILELSYDAVSEKYDEYHKYMEQLGMLHTSIANAEVAKQQGEAMEEYATDMVKLMEVARRIARGAKVPATDEKKLMEYSMELYMSAKNMAMLAKQREKEEYDSLWEDEEEPEENVDPMEVADNTEVNLAGPALEDVAMTIENATAAAPVTET